MSDEPESATTISDPARIRALAHPTRLKLLEILGGVEDATATECAPLVGESVASCSFHLRMLAKYGYVEPAERRGREKPWRLVTRRRDLRPDPEVDGSLPAVVAVAHVTLDAAARRTEAFLAQAASEDDRWVQATSMVTSELWLTRDEMAELSGRIQSLAEDYLDRSRDASLRPEGARRSHLFASLHPDPEPTGVDER